MAARFQAAQPISVEHFRTLLQPLATLSTSFEVKSIKIYTW